VSRISPASSSSKNRSYRIFEAPESRREGGEEGTEARRHGGTEGGGTEGGGTEGGGEPARSSFVPSCLGAFVPSSLPFFFSSFLFHATLALRSGRCVE